MRILKRYTSLLASSQAVSVSFILALQLENLRLALTPFNGIGTEWAGASMIFGEEEAPAYDHLDVSKLDDSSEVESMLNRPCRPERLWQPVTVNR